MSESYKGIWKLIEEMSELGLELGKLGPFPFGPHPDGKGPLVDRIPAEIADVYAALDYFMMTNFSNAEAFIFERRNMKLKKYIHWQLDGIKHADNQNPPDGVLHERGDNGGIDVRCSGVQHIDAQSGGEQRSIPGDVHGAG